MIQRERLAIDCFFSLKHISSFVSFVFPSIIIAIHVEHFVLFLIYTWTCSAYALTLFGWNYFFCADEDCTFHVVVVHLVRVMTVLCFGAFLFTSSMLMNVTYGLMTGIGTIDRLKKKATNTMSQSDEERELLYYYCYFINRCINTTTEWKMMLNFFYSY